jgi:TetR/AcrR family transcriptional repressor of bet genes
MTTTVQKKPKKDRRQDLIEATVRSIAEVGVTGTTVTTIMQRAGLSRGMLHLYFKNKDELIEATARHFSVEYYRKLQVFLDRAGDDPAARLNALIDADFSTDILNIETVVLWNALRSLAHTNQRIRQHTTTRDESLVDIYREIYDAILGSDDKDPSRSSDLANGTIALLEGMWSDYYLYPESFDRANARRIVWRMISAQVAD